MTVTDQLLKAFERHVDDRFDDAEDAVYEIARANAPEDTGELKRSADIDVNERGPKMWTMTLGFDAEHADYLDDPRGTDGGATIKPRSGDPKARLKFRSRTGQVIYAREVKVSEKHRGWFSDNVADWWAEALDRSFR